MRFILFVLLCFVVDSPLDARQDKPPVVLDGAWSLDLVKSRKYWDTPELKRMANDIAMFPVAAPEIVFTESQMSFGEQSGQHAFEIQTFDKNAQKFVVRLRTRVHGAEGGQAVPLMAMEFDAVDENTLVTNLPMSVFGPMRVVYTRNLPAGETDVKSPIAEINGDWDLDVEATKRMWRQVAEASALTNYTPIGESAMSDAQTIRVSQFEIEYSDQTYAPWKLQSAEGKVFVLGNNQPKFEIRKLTDSIIQVADENRYLFAIYTRSGASALAVQQFPQNTLARSFIGRFKTNQPRPPLSGRRGVIAKSGSVEIDSFNIDRRRASYSAVGADIVNMRMALFVGLPDRHYGLGNQRMIRLNRLDEIVDNLGTVLLDQKRRKRIEMLDHAVVSRAWMTRRSGINGPGIEFTLNAPAIGATKIKKIAGEVEVTRITKKMIRFPRVRDLVGKKLTHPLLGDQAFQIAIDNGRFPEFELRISPEGKALIAYWHLVGSSGERLSSGSMGRSATGETKGFAQKIPDDATLVMEINTMAKSQTFPFSFEDVSIE